MRAWWRWAAPWWFAVLVLGLASLSDQALLLGMPAWILLALAAAVVAWDTLTGAWGTPTPAARSRALRLLDHGLLMTLLVAALAVGTLAHAPMFDARHYGAGPPRLVAVSTTLLPALIAFVVVLIVRAGSTPSPRRMALLAAALFLVFPAAVLVSADVRLVTEFELTPRDGWRLPAYEAACAVLLVGAIVLTGRARRDVVAGAPPAGLLPAASARAG